MTFCSELQDKNEIIKKAECSNNFYNIDYLDGSCSSFINSDKEFLKQIEDKMINQAIDRDIDEFDMININKCVNLFLSLCTLSFTNVVLNEKLLPLACVGFALTLYCLNNVRKNSKKLNELKKYRILLKNYEEFKNNPNISEVVEFESLYREPVNIFTIDNFSLSDIKAMKKVLKNKKC